MSTKIYAGEVLELRKGEFENSKTSDMENILNVVIGVARKLVGDITVQTKQTAVLFRAAADKAIAELAVGDIILLHDVIRNPRVYVTERQTRVETVDINLSRDGSVKKLEKADYEANLPALSKMMLAEKDLEFVDADRVALANAGTETDGESVDKVFEQ